MCAAPHRRLPVARLLTFDLLLHDSRPFERALTTSRDCSVCCPAPARAGMQPYSMLNKSHTCAQRMGSGFGVGAAPSRVGSCDPSRGSSNRRPSWNVARVAALPSQPLPAAHPARHGRRTLRQQALGRRPLRWRCRRRLRERRRGASDRKLMIKIMCISASVHGWQRLFTRLSHGYDIYY